MKRLKQVFDLKLDFTSYTGNGFIEVVRWDFDVCKRAWI